MYYKPEYLAAIEAKLRSTGIEANGIYYGPDCAEVFFYDSDRYMAFCAEFENSSQERKAYLSSIIFKIKDRWIRDVFVVELADKIGWKHESVRNG